MGEPMINFERGSGGDREHVCATVYLPLGVTLELWSDEPVAERRWDLEEVQLDPTDDRPPVRLTALRGTPTKLGESELMAFVRREWDREVGLEAARAAAARGQESLDVHAA